MFGYTTLWFIINIFIKHISDWHHSSDIHISQGSVATCLRRDGIFKHSFVANLSLRLPAKEFWKSVNIWWSYRQESGVLFFDSQYRSVHEQMIEATGRCVILSESDLPALVAVNYRKYGDSPEVRHLARDVIRWECRPYTTMQPPPLAHFLKLRLACTGALPLFK